MSVPKPILTLESMEVNTSCIVCTVLSLHKKLCKIVFVPFKKITACLEKQKREYVHYLHSHDVYIFQK